jgi:adenylate cyclase, class 2
MRSMSKTGLRKSGRAAAERAHTEIEVKLRIPDKRRLLGQLAGLEAKQVRARLHEMNTLYDTPDGSLARHGRMLRLRVERTASRANGVGRARKSGSGKAEISALLTLKGPSRGHGGSKPGPYKVREERELRISDAEGVPAILGALGVRPWFRYEKFRSIFELPGMRNLKLALDETPIGVFLELEGPREEINRAAGLLGFARSGYISKSYGALFMDARGLARRRSEKEPVPFSGVPDMVFGRKKFASHHVGHKARPKEKRPQVSRLRNVGKT